MTPRRAPRPLVDEATPEVRLLVRAAQALEPPEGARERVWEAISHRFAPLAEAEPSLARVLEAARAAVEPPPGARERIWRQLQEESLARAGLAEPRRLVDTDGALGPLLAHAAHLEPPVGSRTRLRPEPARPRLRWVLALPVAAAAVAAFVLLQPPVAPPAPVVALRPSVVALPETPLEAPTPVEAPPAFALVPGRVLTGPEAAGRTLHVAGIGDLVLVGAKARLRVERADATGARVRIESGAVAIHAEKRTSSNALTIVGGPVEATVVGTIFAVSTDGRAGAVDVLEGLVQVRHPRGTDRVGAGRALAAGGDANAQRAQSLANGAALRALTGLEPRSVIPVTPATLDKPPAGTAVAAAPLVGPQPLAPQGPLVTRSVEAAPVAPDPTANVAARPSARDEAERVLAGLSGPVTDRPEDLRRQAREALGRKDFEPAARTLFRLAQHPALDAAERANALVTAADLFDGPLAVPWAAILVREKLASQSVTHGSAARFELMLGYFELGSLEDARQAAETCTQECSESVRPIAMFVRARVLQEAGDPGLLDAARDLRSVPQGSRATAIQFSERADRFATLGQVARARRDAAFALALDPRGPNATHLKQLLGDQ